MFLPHGLRIKTTDLRKENRTNQVVLNDDDPRVVRFMLDYFYGFDYDVDAEPSCEMGELELHAYIYGIGEKYESMDLKTLAASKFTKSAVTADMDYGDLLQAIRPIYSLTPSTDRGLRDIAINLWLICASEIFKEKQQEAETVMREVPDFVIELSTNLAPRCFEERQEAICRCGNKIYWRGTSVFRDQCPHCTMVGARPVHLQCCRDYK